MRPGTSNWRARLTFFVERVRRNDLTPARRRRLIRRAVLRTLATTVVVLVALYYLLPLDHNKNVPVTLDRRGTDPADGHRARLTFLRAALLLLSTSQDDDPAARAVGAAPGA